MTGIGRVDFLPTAMLGADAEPPHPRRSLWRNAPRSEVLVSPDRCSDGRTRVLDFHPTLLDSELSGPAKGVFCRKTNRKRLNEFMVSQC
jgi:hypothetical protein